jgi:hypothetical protein
VTGSLVDPDALERWLWTRHRVRLSDEERARFDVWFCDRFLLEAA